MSLSRRAFVRSLGAGGVGVVATDFVIGRGRQEASALGRPGTQGAGAAARPSRAADAIYINRNENPRGPAASVLRVLQERTNSRVGRYPEPTVEELGNAIAKKLGGTRDNVLIATGSGVVLEAAVRAFASPARGVVSASPSYNVPNRTAEAIGAPVRLVPVRDDLTLDLDAMAVAAGSAGLAYVCNPNNPTSTVQSQAAISDYVHRVRAASPETVILIDEAYIEYADEASTGTVVPLALEHANVFVARTFSKAYGMAGLRLGYAFGQPDTLARLRAAWGLGSVNILTAAAGIAALGDTAHLEAERAENARVREFTLSAFREMGFRGPASHANFVFLDLGRPAKVFRDACAERNVFVGPDAPPLEQTHCRITIGTMEEMRRAVEVFRVVLRAPVMAAARG